MLSKLVDYNCPRCGYETSKRSNMRTHFNRVRVCEAKIADINLTSEIKNDIFENRVLQTDIQNKPISVENYGNNVNILGKTMLNQVYNNIQNVQNVNNILVGPTINNIKSFNQFKLNQNILNSIEPLEKLDQLLNYRNIKLLDFDDSVEECFENRKSKINNKSNRFNHSMKETALFECINEATRTDKGPNYFNVFYDTETKRIKIRKDNKWKEYLEESGICEIIEILRLNYLNSYEYYLLRKIYDKTNSITAEINERLLVYYKFIYAFDLLPYVHDSSDKLILGYDLKESNSYHIEEQAMKKYAEAKKSLKKTEKKEIQTKILNIIKSNTKANVNDINLALLNIINVDQDFKDQLLAKLLNIETNTESLDNLIEE